MRITPRKSGTRDQRGAALLEFALVVPVFVFILYGLVFFGVALSTKHSVTSAAAEGARAAVGANTYAVATSQAQTRITQVLGPANGKYTVTIPVSSTACGSGQCIEVTVKWDYAHYPVVAGAFGLDILVGQQDTPLCTSLSRTDCRFLASKSVVQWS